MSTTRPKRKATINKSYSDAVDESAFEDPRGSASSTTSSRSSSQTSKSTSSGLNGTTRARQNTSNSSKKTSEVSVSSSAVSASKIKDNGESGVPYNWQPMPTAHDHFSHKLNLDDAYVDIPNQSLVCPNQPPFPSATPDNTVTTNAKRRKSKECFSLRKGDYIYMISEPPGEPYYIGRIMGFKLKNSHRHSNLVSSSPSGDSTPTTHSTSTDTQGPSSTENETSDDASRYQFQIQWFYRPRDISKTTSDSRLLYASMHTDTCPLASFRGMVTVRHKQEIEESFAAMNNGISPHHTNGNKNSNNPKKVSTPPQSNAAALEQYCQQPNAFYFHKLFDRYMIKFYDIIPTASLLIHCDNELNNSQNFLVALHKRFEFVFMEPPRAKSFLNSLAATSSCHCEQCGQWCAPQESVTCASCHKFYHMLCLNPPLLKKPSRGFSWSCAPCNKKHEIEYQSKRMLMLSHDNKSSNERELSVELSTLSAPASSPASQDYDDIENEDNDTHSKNIENDNDDHDNNKSNNDSDNDMNSDGADRVGKLLPKYETMAIDFLNHDADLTVEQRRLKEEWCMRYLGMHARLEDGVDVEDRSPYPRASTRLGSKHQATSIPEYHNHPIVYYDTQKSASSGNPGIKKKPGKKKKLEQEDSDTVKLPIPDEFKDVPPKDFPDWLQPRPKGYIERGVDDGEGRTATLLWKPLESDKHDDFSRLDAYINQCSPVAEKLDILPTSPNFMDAILHYYLIHNGNTQKALKDALALTREKLKEPTFSKEEVKKFEAGVKKYGSELYPTYKEVKSQPCSMIVRFYYLWKKTKNGKLIWGNYEGRMHKKLQNQVKEEVKPDKIQPKIDTLVDPNDDSSYESEKILDSKKIFGCKHCHTNQSTQWFRITGYDTTTKLKKGKNKEGNEDLMKNDVVGLCFRCARLWRRYAVIWEDPNEVQKKQTKGVGGWKKKVEAELVHDAELILSKAEENDQGVTYDIPDVTSSILGAVKRKPITSAANATTKKTQAKNNITKKSGSSIKEEEVSAPPIKKRKPNSSTLVKEASKSTVDNPKENGHNSSAKVKVKKEAVKLKPEPKQVKTVVKQESESPSLDETKPVKRRKTDSHANGKETKRQDTKHKETTTGGATSLVKKQKRNLNGGQSTVLSSPVFNDDYIIDLPSKINKIDKKTIPVMTKDILKEIVTNYRLKSLTDMNIQVQPYQVPQQAKIRNPFENDERNCSLCLDYDTLESSIREMLICSNCGVNVHASCVGIQIPSKVPLPIKEWLCQPCINDLNPHHSTLYTCSLCFANDSNHELAMFGSPLVKPDYLRSIHDTGKWCHLICALFNYEHITFKPILHSAPPQRKTGKESMNNQKSIIEVMHNTFAIESVSEVHMRNYASECGICTTSGGSMICCDVCSEPPETRTRFHVTCAQDSPNYKLGFKLIPQSGSNKDGSTVSVGSSAGRLKPVLSCPKHDSLKEGIFNMRRLGRRTSSISKDGYKPLIFFFIEDIIKFASNTSVGGSNRLSGPQFKAHNFINLIKIFSEQEEKKKNKLSNVSQKKIDDEELRNRACDGCGSTSSPMWWHEQNQPMSGSEAGNCLCQSCHHNDNFARDDSDGSAAKLSQTLHEPISGDFYGLHDQNDRLSDVYKPTLLEAEPEKPPPTGSQPHRSRISIGDILS